MTPLQEQLDVLGAPLFLLTERPGGPIKERWAAPKGWQLFTADGNDGRLAGRQPGQAVAMVTGHAVTGIDVDPRNGGEKSFALMRDGGLIPRSTT